ncbi:nitroreductase family protein [Metabacillus malikii]|uniref:Putative NAD(P)H nitroreductase n=1 Tax=Metabacillus malikii TaxID=1504265 RepID=A0ABT9ZDI8_9BACI|nr:nitroreductase [Metabacillus malikii]MDQ0229912.1 nitroreductase [Metabacillus malikii]
MDIFTAIKERRSVGVVKPDAVPTELIEQILEAGTWAPAHHRTEPWRFFVLTGDARKTLGQALAKYLEKSLDDPSSEESKTRLEKVAAKALRAPVIIAVAVEPSEDKKVIVKEEYAAVNAAIQNMLLAAHALGLGAIWRTGQVCYSDEVKQRFNLSERGEMLGFIYLGYPDTKQLTGKRTHFSELTTWLDKEED